MFYLDDISLSGPALAWIGECEESSPCSAHPS